MVAGAAVGLLERDLEIAHLQRSVDHCSHGVGRLVVIEGPAGIGKTTLIGEARVLARDSGFRVLAARGAQLEQGFAFGIVRQLFDPLLVSAGDAERGEWLAGAAELAAHLFGPRATLNEADRESLYPRLHGLYWMCCNLASRAPLALVVDDAQWADEPSLEFLGFLTRRLEELSVLVVAAMRTAGSGSPLALSALRADSAARILEPQGLSVSGVGRLLVERLGCEVEDAFAQTCRDATAGNPFLLGMLLFELQRGGVEPIAANAARVRSLGPQRVAEAVLTRLGRSSPAAAELARAIAILGDGARPADAAAFAGLDEMSVLKIATTMRLAGLLDAESGLAFVHPIIGAAIYESVLPAERIGYHIRAASLFEPLLSHSDRRL